MQKSIAQAYSLLSNAQTVLNGVLSWLKKAGAASTAKSMAINSTKNSSPVTKSPIAKPTDSRPRLSGLQPETCGRQASQRRPATGRAHCTAIFSRSPAKRTRTRYSARPADFGLTRELLVQVFYNADVEGFIDNTCRPIPWLPWQKTVLGQGRQCRRLHARRRRK